MLVNLNKYLFYKEPSDSETGSPPAEEQEVEVVNDVDKEADDQAIKDQQDDVADLLGITKEEVVETKEETKEEVKEEITEPEAKEEEVVEEVQEGEEEEDPLLAELGKLSQQLADFGKGETKPVDTKSVEEPKEEKKVETKQETLDITPGVVKEYLSKEQFGETFNDEERTQFNTVLSRLRDELIKDVRNVALQDGMDIFPQMINYRLQGYIAAQEFWQTNPDLKGFVDDNSKYNAKQFVLNKATEIQKTNPEWSLGQVYKQTAEEVRKLLGNRLDKYAQTGQEPKVRKPALPRKPGSARRLATPNNSRKLENQEEAAFNDLLDFDL